MRNLDESKSPISLLINQANVHGLGNVFDQYVAQSKKSMKTVEINKAYIAVHTAVNKRVNINVTRHARRLLITCCCQEQVT